MELNGQFFHHVQPTLPPVVYAVELDSERPPLHPEVMREEEVRSTPRLLSEHSPARLAWPAERHE